ncbi:4-hydroxyphenylacetate 3-hydroxylase family protein [Bradyrhizobium sp.]|jgi:4-hydroxyphenylacetate 3-monooxygenase|uniref:4-hydroxyphenylacetate 3-hydroxylase family protein n=1 Tax=Bradyrhizobium sp. TaxID=376 RepID=UPI003C193509
MLRSGDDYLKALRDGRRVYVGSELVNDVTSHIAFRNTAHSFAELYDRKRAQENLEAMSFEDGGERHSIWFLRSRSKDDLRRRAEGHRRIAKWSYGLLGRSPDHVASFVAGLAMHSELFETNRKGFGSNLLNYYDELRRKDLFASYVVIAPQGARDPSLYQREGRQVPSLHVVAEMDDGIVLEGVKMLGTAAIFSDETWIGNLLPLSPDQKHQAVTCAVPLNTPGVSIWARKPFERHAVSAIDNPFSSRFDESDAIVVFDKVKVPWERVFLLDDVVMSREMYFKTPSHVMGNHQAIIRFHEKLKFILGIAYKAAEINSVAQVPAVRDTLAKLAAAEAGLGAMISGQIEEAETTSTGYAYVNRRQLYAALHWCTNNYHSIAETVRELLGAGPFQMPADASFLDDPALRETFETYWSVADTTAVDRFKFMKLAWDYLGSELASRHGQYERFYAGPQFVNALYNFTNCPWNDRKGAVEAVMNEMKIPDKVPSPQLNTRIAG